MSSLAETKIKAGDAVAELEKPEEKIVDEHGIPVSELEFHYDGCRPGGGNGGPEAKVGEVMQYCITPPGGSSATYIIENFQTKHGTIDEIIREHLSKVQHCMTSPDLDPTWTLYKGKSTAAQHKKDYERLKAHLCQILLLMP